MANYENPYQAPSGESEQGRLFPADDAMTVGYGTFGVRAAARIIDTVLGLGLGFVAGAAVGLVGASMAASGSLSYGWQRRLGGFSAGSIIFSLLGPILYHTAAEAMGGATVGKALLGLRVLREDLTPCTFGSALGRSFAYFIDALFCGLIGYSVMNSSRQQQRLGDKWARTVVVRASTLDQTRAPLPGIGGGIALGLVLWAAALFVGTLLKLF